MRAKKVYESIGDVLKPKSWDDIKQSIESAGEPDFDYWMNFILEFNKLFDGKLQGSVQKWEYNIERQYRFIELQTVIGSFKFIIDWHVSREIPNISVDIGTSTRHFLGPVVITDDPKKLAENVLEGIRKSNSEKDK